MEFNEKLKLLIDAKGITQKQLACDLNIAPTTIGNYVRGIREPDFFMLKQLAAYFNVSCDYLLDYNYSKGDNAPEEELAYLFKAMLPNSKKFFLKQGRLLLECDADTLKDAEE